MVDISSGDDQGNCQEERLEERVRHLVLGLGADVCGMAGIERFAEAPKGYAPTDIWAGCRSVVALGLAISKGLLDVAPRLVYGHFNGGVCEELDWLALRAAKALEREFGCRAVPVPCDAPNEYWDAEALEARGLMSMKHTARLCGLGSIGKSSLLINPQFGNRLTVGAILTNLELASDPLCEDLCIEGCHRCVDACPVGAIRDGRVVQALCRPNTYGQTARGFGTVDCNACRTVCPRRYGV